MDETVALTLSSSSLSPPEPLLLMTAMVAPARRTCQESQSEDMYYMTMPPAGPGARLGANCLRSEQTSGRPLS